MNIEQTTLENGVNTLFINSPGAKAASVQFWFRAGSALEEEKDWGIAHFLEHMFFKGTETRPGAKIAEEVEAFGGEINAFTSFDYTCYYINTPNDHIGVTVEILMDMVSNPMFKTDDIIPEREVVWEEYKRSQDNPSQFNFQKLQSLAFTDNYAHPILGKEETIKSFTGEQLTEFRNKFYNIQNSLIVIAGDLQKDELTEKIESFSFPSGSKSHFPEFKLQGEICSDVHAKQVRQALLTLSIQAPSFNDHEATSEDLALNCLGHGETSKLYNTLVVDSKLATSASTSTMYFANGGCHFIRLTFPVTNTEKVYKELLNCLGDIQKNSFSADDATKIKNQYIASKVFEKESIESFAFSLGHGFAQNGNIHCDEEFVERIKNTSIDDINKGLSSIFGRDIQASLQVPEGELSTYSKVKLEQFLKKMKALSPKKVKSKSSGAKTSKYDPQTQLIELKPGIKLLYRQSEMTPTFVFHAFLKGGVHEENKKQNGVYNLLSSTISKGYAKMPFEKLKNDLEQKSCSFYGFSGRNAYGLSMHGLSENFNHLTDHFFGTLLKPTFPSKHLTLEKELIKRTLENFKEDPVKQCFKKFQSIVFNGHPYAFSLLGEKSSLKNIKSNTIKELHQKNMNKKEIVFTYCGSQGLNEVLESITPYIDGIKPRKPKKTTYKKVKALKKQFNHISFEREQTHIVIGKPSYKLSSKNNIFLKMLTSYLSGQSSDLFVEVRDRLGLCYSVQPIHFSALEAGYWGIYIGTGNDKVIKAMAAIEGILNNLRENGISKETFEKIKAMIAGQELMNLQTIEDYAQNYSIPALHGLGFDFHFKVNELVQGAEYEDFQKFLSQFLKDDWSRVVVGSYQETATN
ncbi:MAG: insulinase family protein [Bacteriovoracaceae bacterium]|jgi:zinc protease|nr:insulinase family protein [Bacteriovoracaceae bacterium]